MRKEPVGISPDRLSFSWSIGGERIRRQSAWKVLVSADANALGENCGDVWDSGN
ncbi:hypothetical protein [Paenibacillus mesophilus]|uniref:glycoside hydrolase family 78 protein n=1 Tax=Paenibacillus mesophilus TaxID=2582849 RepID=UPI0013052061|nr:hypothetical protein [Paenibacillus mesophilus]